MRYQTLAVALLIASATLAPPQQPAQTFRTSVQAVEVDVRVVGKDGRFVTDLGTADFELLEDGVRQTIQSVVLIDASKPASTPEASAGNAGAAAAEAGQAIWIFVFDSPHLASGSLQRTRNAVVAFIDQKFHDGDLGGVVVDGRMANNRLTSSKQELRKAAVDVRITGDASVRQMELTREWPRFQDDYEAMRIALDDDEQTLQIVVQRACSEDPSACNGRVPVDQIVKEKARRLVSEMQRASMLTLSTVEALSNGLARVPGPKTIVFFTEGFVIEKLQADVQRAVGRANRAGAHFYTVDARGLNKGSAGATIIDQPVASSVIGSGPKMDAATDGPNSLAVDTGALAIRNDNNFGRVLDDIQRDAGTYYVVAYAPTNGTFDGKFRTISIKVNRAGVRVRARRGYLALEPSRLLRALPLAAISRPDLPSTTAAPDLPSGTTAEFSPAAVSVEKTLDPVVPARTAAVRTKVDAGKIGLAFGEDPTTATDAAQAGWAAYERGDVESAVRDLSRAAAVPNVQPWVHYVLGMSYLALQRYRDAAQSWERVRQAAPTFETLYFNLADAYIGQRDESTAIRVLRDAERRWPADPEIQNAIGVIQVRRGALDAAIDSFERATTIAPEEALGYFNLGRVRQMRSVKRQRYDRLAQAWLGGEDDRRKAIANFEKYLQLGGPYVQQAKEALSLLGWTGGRSQQR